MVITPFLQTDTKHIFDGNCAKQNQELLPILGQSL